LKIGLSHSSKKPKRLFSNLNRALTSLTWLEVSIYSLLTSALKSRMQKNREVQRLDSAM
jgi:hypothetical protein